MAEEADGWERIKAHIKLYRENPEQAHEWNPYGKVVPALLLTSTGRKSGKARPLPLIYGRDGDNFIIIGSKGGAPEDPQWRKNLLANPDAEVQVAREHYKVRARDASGAERDRLWEMMVGILPQYAEYQARTDRKIPVVVLERRS
jgi:deazaflavin-dependent oxidoreductase (nitroreductase family)